MKNTQSWVFFGLILGLLLSKIYSFMIIQTSTCDFLIEESGRADGCISVYSNFLEELHRLFGSSEIEYSPRSDWKYRICTCKQDLANALILLVKEIDYSNFNFLGLHQA